MKVSSFPVGFEHELDMYPLDFEEFLWACNISEDVISMLKDCYEQLRPIPDFLHKQIMERYRQYLIVGGMPEVVMTYLENEDFTKTINNQKDILSGYRNDISKYAGNEKVLVKSVFDAIPGQLSKQDKRFVLASIEKNASRRKYGAPTQWLVDAGIAYYSFNVGSFELPFPIHENIRLYKLFFVDSGLMCAMMLNNIQAQVLTGDNVEVTRCVCNKAGINSKEIITGNKIDTLSDVALSRLLKRNNIFAKLSPIQKARIVRVLKQNGNVVGYMGDGINDSPALTNSDVGISVDTAVDIAKETADIILLEKDLNVLLDGVMERKKNICKFNEIYKNGNKLQLWGSSFSNYCKHCTTIFT